MEPVHLFDFLTNQVNKNPDDPFLASIKTKNGQKQWVRHTFKETQIMANRVSQLLIDLGLKKDDKIAIIATNCSEWNFVDLGAIQIGIVDVPMYPTISEKDYEFIFEDSKIQYAFVGDAEIYQKVKPLLGKISSLKEIYTFHEIKDAKVFSDALPPENKVNLNEIQARTQKVQGDDLATIIYTSGTTGYPKGVMLSHHNILSNVLSVTSVLPFLQDGQKGEKVLSFLPLCHSFERTVFYAYLYLGMYIHYAESLETIGDNLKEVKPHCFSTVPRLLEKVYEKIIAKGSELTGIKRSLFFWAIDVGSQYKIGEDLGFFYNLKLSIARKLIFSKWQEALGGKVKFIITGAAAMQPRLITLFTAAGIDVIEGYGLTETAPVLTVNRLDEKQRCTGTVGIPIPGVEVKIAEDGEILARGENIMKGYFNRPDITAEVIDKDGWFYTGDIGVWIEKNNNKFLKITDRKKELFKTAGGKYVAPQTIENKMKESNFIEQMMVIGGDDKKFVSALIVPSLLKLQEWAKNQGINIQNNRELIQEKKVNDLIQREIDRYNPDFGQWEQVKKFILLDKEWTIDSGELTPTLKLKRKILYERYAKEIAQLYS